MRALLLLVSLLLAPCAAEEGGSAPQPRLRPAFSTRLSTYSIKTAAEKLGRRDWSELTQGNKIVLPQRVLSQLQGRSLPYTQFQICNPECKQQRLYTGPLDFCAADGECYLPAWMMRQLKLKEGGTLSVATAQFPSGVFARFQPHSSDFLDVSNHYYLLLKTLDHFACLTAGCPPQGPPAWPLERPRARRLLAARLLAAPRTSRPARPAPHGLPAPRLRSSTIRVTDGSRTHLLDVLEVQPTHRQTHRQTHCPDTPPRHTPRQLPRHCLPNVLEREASRPPFPDASRRLASFQPFIRCEASRGRATLLAAARST